ncbi:HNH endonuclease [Microcella alkaliphila]|uniref:HNH endonuclease n=1 Tax=Microcella alkaliphila TaxID=279828 RepID=A0A4Q7TFT4_9MICO|nr:HNH endonuclease [Microcella alkaliphila]RZT59331.1 HNH endonuclease [Microcella alkaliphila]
MSNRSIRDGKGKAAYKRKRKRLLARVRDEGLVCHICGGDIDVTLDRRDPMSFTADHIEPLANGGDLVRNEIRPAHLRCNARRGTAADVAIEAWGAS